MTSYRYFQPYAMADIQRQIRFRDGETKLGEHVAVPGDQPLEEFLGNTRAEFVVLGIAEDIGVKANYGRPGTASAWNAFLASFLNVQANRYTGAEKIAVLGHFLFDSLKAEIEKSSASSEDKVMKYRKVVSIIDDAVAKVIQLIATHEKVPIVIGGGHNNCYPIIKGVASALNLKISEFKGINCVNLDAHLDYRLAEGRHSGNGFRYAKQDGFLQKYFALGIHENYIPQHTLNDFDTTEGMLFVTYEDVFVRQQKNWINVLDDAVKFVGIHHAMGVELDLDSIENIPSSAAAPCGLTPREALQYIDYMANHCNVSYLHICEGIASGHENAVGKLLSYLVGHFVKARVER